MAVAVEWNDPPDLEMIGHDPLLAGEFLEASRITPSVEPHPTSVTSASSGPMSLGGTMSVMPLHFAAAFLDHHAADVRIGEFVADERAVFIVFVRRRGEDVTGNAGHGARGDAALGVLETQ